MNVAFVGNGYHLKYTKSSQFFIDLLKAQWPGTRVVSEEWRWAYLPDRMWDLVVFWQQMPEPDLLRAVSIRHAVLVPMEDDCSRERDDWVPYLGCSVLCFSKALADRMEGWGHSVFRAAYFPPVPPETADWSGGVRRGFFWPRKSDLTWRHVRPFLGEWDGRSVHVHVTEPALAVIPDDDVRRYHVETTRWFASRGDLFDALRGCQVFFAPRRAEGIGMAFLEAMALGMAVVAPDASTMNEYIDSGRNGWLYDPDAPVALDLSHAAQWAKQARQGAIEGRARWEGAIPGVQNWLAPGGRTASRPDWTPEAVRARRKARARYVPWVALQPLRALKRYVKTILFERRP